jgi:transposase
VEHGTTLLLGLEGLSVERVELLGDGIRRVHVVTAVEYAAGCPGCGVVSTSLKQNTTTRPRDLPYGVAGVQLRWHKRRWRCQEIACVRKTFTEQIDQVPAGMRTTTRLRCAMAGAVADGRSEAEVADAFGVSWPTTHRAVVVAVAALPAEPEPAAVLGIDETRYGTPKWVKGEDGKWRLTDPWETAIVDLSGTQGLLTQVTGRTGQCVIDWLQARDKAFRDAVQVVALDPSAPYAAAVRKILPDAQISVDHFHLVKLANDTVSKVRRRVTYDAHGRRGRTSDPAWANRRRLLRARERMSEQSFAKMWNDIVGSEPTGQLLAAWIAKELLRDLLALAHTNPTRHQIGNRLFTFYDWCARADVPEVTILAETISKWQPEVLVFLRTGITNAATEGTNRLIKQVKRAACGFRNRQNYRGRVRLHTTRSRARTAARTNRQPAQS